MAILLFELKLEVFDGVFQLFTARVAAVLQMPLCLGGDSVFRYGQKSIWEQSISLAPAYTWTTAIPLTASGALAQRCFGCCMRAFQHDLW